MKVICRIVVAYFVLSLVVFISCGKKKAESNATKGKVTITFWHSLVQNTAQALDELLEKFHAEYPHIHIDAQYVPTGDALIQKLITAIRANNAPDLAWIHSNFLQDLVEAGAIYNMMEFIHGPDSLTAAEMADFYPALLEQASWRGTLYSIPMEATDIALIYNRDIFRAAKLDPDHPPATWDELTTYAKMMTIDRNGDGNIDQWGFVVPVFPSSGSLADWMVWLWTSFLWAAGGDLINEAQTEVQFNSPAGVEALVFWKELYWDIRSDLLTTDADIAFASGILAMTLDGPWNLPRYRELKGIDWGVAPLPKGPQRQVTIAGGEYIAIFKQCQHPAEAWKFIKWMIRPEIQALWSMKSGYLPVRKSVSTVPEYKAFLAENPGLRAFVQLMDQAVVPTPVDYFSLQINRNLAEAIERAIVGKEDAKSVLDQAAIKSNELLKKVPSKQ